MKVETEPVVQQQPREIQAAAPAARRRTLMFLAVTAITGLALIGGIEEWMHVVSKRAASDPHRAINEIAYVIQVLGAVISLSLIGLALVIVRVSWRVYVAKRYPPPGMTLVIDVPVFHGASAARIAILGFALGTLLGGMAVVFPYVLLRTLTLFAPGQTG